MRLPKLLLPLLCLCLVCGSVVGLAAQEPRVVRVAAASDLQPVMPAFAAAYERETGVKLVVSLGASGTLATQIENGGPFDIFLGADFTFPERVVALGMAVEKDPVPYARGTLVLWARKDVGLTPFTIDLLTDARVKRVAIANPDRAPFGRAAMSAVEHLGMAEVVKPKLVTAENVAQAAQFVESGNAQVGFVSLTFANSAHAKEIGQFTYVPLLYPEIRQCAVVIKGSAHAVEAEKFLSWLTSQTVQDHLQEYGLTPVK